MGCEFTGVESRPHSYRESRLEGLFSEIARAIEVDELQSALRLADCACRCAPEDATCILVHARLLIKLGMAELAVQKLDGRTEPQMITALGLAFLAQGLWEQAASICTRLLARHAVDAVEDLDILASELCKDDSFNGWIGLNSKLQLVGQVRPGSRLALAIVGKDMTPIAFQMESGSLDSFTSDLPPGLSGRVSARADGSHLLGSAVLYPPNFGLTGWTLAEDGYVLGKVHMEWAPARPIVLELTQPSGERAREVLLPENGTIGGTRFSISLDVCRGDTSPLDVCVVLPDGRCEHLSGSPLKLDASSTSRERGGVRVPTPSAWVNPYSKTKIDIVIPVYAGLVETRRAIESVLETTTRSEAEVVVVNDASPDLALSELLIGLASDRHITLITNSTNRGFPVSANRGMNLHLDRDVVLLNADTEVFGDWLERLSFAAYSQQDIATVTPLGEAASIVTYEKNGRTTAAGAREIDRIARAANARKVVELPVGVGFCLYIKRACIDQAGELDEASFDKGYGEENEFCLRTRELGWRHAAATDVFVRHHGARSFGRAQTSLMERNGRVLNRLYPSYNSAVTAFIENDPLQDARRAIDMRRLATSQKGAVLLLTGNLIGGVKRHVQSRQSELLDLDCPVLVLRPSEDSRRLDQVRLTAPGQALENLLFQTPKDLALLRSFLIELNLKHIEFHHFMGVPSEVLEMLSDLGADYQIYIHDYSWVCPRMSLTNGNGSYCGEPLVAECEICIRRNGTALEPSLTVKALRDRSARIWGRANRIVAPTEDVRSRLAGYFPNLPVDVNPWEAPIARRIFPKKTRAGRVRVAVIGGISGPKGLHVLLECARDSVDRELDLDFIVIGYTGDDSSVLATACTFITGPYAEDEVQPLLEREQCDVALIPSVVPETWCYALTHALTHGLPIVAFKHGAVAERMLNRDDAVLLPLSSQASDINDTLMQVARTTYLSPTTKEYVMQSDSTTHEVPATDGLTPSVQFLPLPVGIYTFTVTEGAPTTTALNELALPAIQVGVGPVQSEGTVEFVSRAQTTDRWLSRRRDMIIAKISGGNASLMLTSLRSPDSPALGINIRRLDSEMGISDSSLDSAQGSSVGPDGNVPAQILAHIHRVGDIPFSDGWAGSIGDSLWIEAFAIGSAGPLPTGMFEYCGVTSDGLQTPWLSNQMLCGSRGRATPMVGFAVRLKPEAAERYDCTYTGQFVSGKVVGPISNGDLCCSDLPLDPLWGIEVYAAERIRAGTNVPSHETQNADVA